jgi:hypothetical protein
MVKKDWENLSERSATCKKCGLTARNQFELDDHVSHAHAGDNVADESGPENPERKHEPNP